MRSDGLNDVFGPKGTYISSYEMQVYNRWGQQVFETQTSEGWNGLYRDGPAPEGVYMYTILIRSHNGQLKRLKGTVMILK